MLHRPEQVQPAPQDAAGDGLARVRGDGLELGGPVDRDDEVDLVGGPSAERGTELGPQGATLHAALAENVVEDDIDLVYCCGPLMRALWEALPSGRRGGYAEASAALQPQVLAALQPGDTVMVKGSNGSRMAPIVKALASRFHRTAAASASAQG